MSNGSQAELAAWVLLALALGAAIGLQREFRGHEAGIRTSALVCAAAAMFGQVSLEYGDDRVAAGVVQGIGFLGAGLIFQRRRGVSGVTTAATIWVVAAVGLAVGAHLWLAALLTTVAVLVVLELTPFSQWVFRTGQQAGHPETRGARGPGIHGGDDEGGDDDGGPSVK